VFLEAGSGRLRHIVPDVHLATTYRESDEHPDAFREGETALVEPVVFELDEVEIREGYIEIREADGGKVITVLEFLSPSNKRRGAGQELYLAKQAEVLGSDTSLVEIDLVRAGQRVLALPSDDIPFAHRQDCLACAREGGSATGEAQGRTATVAGRGSAARGSRPSGGRGRSRTIQAGTSAGSEDWLPSAARNLRTALAMRKTREVA
jgi:hypothetical protein